MAERILTQAQKEHMACVYRAKKASQTDLAIHFGVSRTTVRRTLADFGLVTFTEHASPNERKLLEVLKTFEVHHPEQLSNVLKRGLAC